MLYCQETNPVTTKGKAPNLRIRICGHPIKASNEMGKLSLSVRGENYLDTLQKQGKKLEPGMVVPSTFMDSRVGGLGCEPQLG